MSASGRREWLIGRGEPSLWNRRQCVLLGVARSGVYRVPRPANDNDMALMRRIDELYTAWPFQNPRRITTLLQDEEQRSNRKPLQQLMRQLGMRAVGPKPHATKPARRWRDPLASLARQPGDRAAEPGVGGRYHLHPDRARVSLPGGDHRLGQPGGPGLAGCRSPKQMSWSMGQPLEEALARFGRPEIFNTDQGSQ